MADENDWVEWTGGECPVDHDALVEAELVAGVGLIRRACAIQWGTFGDTVDVVRYRVITKTTDNASSIDNMIAELKSVQTELANIESRKTLLQNNIKLLVERIESAMEKETGLWWVQRDQ